MQTKLPDGSVMVSGYVPRDAEYRRVGDKDSSLAHFSVKVGEKPSANVDERGEAIWVRCTCWHAAARAAADIRKGDFVFAIGRTKTGEYTDKNTGEVKTNTELVCEFVSTMRDQPEGSAPPPQAYAAEDEGDFSEIKGDDNDLPF